MMGFWSRILGESKEPAPEVTAAAPDSAPESEEPAFDWVLAMLESGKI
jgi:hypothetical protein